MIVGIVLHDDRLQILYITIAFSIITAKNCETESGSHVGILACHILTDLILAVEVLVLPHIQNMVIR